MLNNAIKLKVAGMTCGHCAQHVTDELKEINGIDRVSVILDAGKISTVDIFVSKDVSDADINAAIAEAGDYQIESIERYGIESRERPSN